MNRDELLDKLAMEMEEWPECVAVAGREWNVDGFEWETCLGVRGPEVVIARRKEYEFEGIREHHWRDRRAELINKPSWDDAPEWAEYLAQDEDGEWFGFEGCPERKVAQWAEADATSRYMYLGRGKVPAGHDWRQTLESRTLSSHIENSDSLVSHRLASEGGSPCMDCGTNDSVHTSNCPSHGWDQGERRMENIGRNGGDGDHYEGITGVKHRVSEFETRHDCNRCGGNYYTPPHDECPCADGETTKSDTGLKFDTDKPRMELLIQGMPRALEAVGEVLTFGAKKYAAHNWKLVDGAEDRYWAAKCRHELSRAKGEEKDLETGLLHLAHEATNALFLLELALANQAEDKP